MGSIKKKSIKNNEENGEATLDNSHLSRYGILLAILISFIALYRTGSGPAIQPEKYEEDQPPIPLNETINVIKTFKYNSEIDNNGIYNAKKAMDARYNNILNWCHKYSDIMRHENVVYNVKVPSKYYVYEVESKITFCVNECSGVHDIIKDMFARLRSLPQDVTSKRYKAFYSRYPDLMDKSRKTILALSPMDMLVNVYRRMYEETIDYKSGKTNEALLTFPEYIKIVGSGARLLASYMTELEKEGSSLAINTSLVDGKGDSRCWKPHWQQCGLCDNKYKPHYILHIDHLEEDLKVLIEMMNDPSISQDWLSSIRSNIEEIQKFSSSEMTTHYWSQITKSDIKEITKKYAIDFNVFGFDPEYYIQFGKE